jgi:hypothetical protein
MKTPSVFPSVVLMALVACQGPTATGVGPHLALARQSPGPSLLTAQLASARPGAEVLEGTNDVRTQAWEAARGLKHTGAWLALGLRVEGEQVRSLVVRAHEGTGTAVGSVDAEDFRRLVDWALYRYVRGQRGEVVLTLRRGEGMWREEVESTGPVLSATPPQAPYEAFLRHQGEALRAPGLSEAARREGVSALKKLEGQVWLQPEEALETAPSPLARYAALMEEE